MITNRNIKQNRSNVRNLYQMTEPIMVLSFKIVREVNPKSSIFVHAIPTAGRFRILITETPL